MQTITIKSMRKSEFDVFGLELITSCGVVQSCGVYLDRSLAEEIADTYYVRGWLNRETNKTYKVYQVNIVELTAYC